MLRLNALIATLAVGAIVSGLTLWWWQGMAQESCVPDMLAAFGGARFIGLNPSIWITIGLVAVAATLLVRTPSGRRFEAVGANPRAAHVAGLNVPFY